jgi:hypothetical protein
LKLGKIFKLFKKGAKHAPKGKRGAAASGFDWPSGMRIGVFGHSNCGKTVYFTVLNEESKVSRDLGLSVTDNPTAGEFLTNYRAIWGLGTSGSAGTMVDLREDKRFPPTTTGEKLLQFNAILDRSKNIPIVAYDYNGKAVSIQQQHELADKVKDFMAGCQGILFFFDPKMLRAELECQAHVASFVNMLETLAPGGGRLPIPVALVVTKADVLPGFKGEGQTVLVNADQEHFLAEDFEIFLEKILSSNRIASNSAWAGSVRDVLVKLKDFLGLIVGRTLDFQVFFSSNTGVAPVKIGADVGRSLYKPPDKMQPVGVREPFYWLLKSIIRNRRLRAFRKLSLYVVTLSILFAIVWSAPRLYVFHLKLNRIRSSEDLAWQDKKVIGQIPPLSVRDIKDGYRDFANSWIVEEVFREFKSPAEDLLNIYVKSSTKEERKKLVSRVDALVEIVIDSTKWPNVRPEGDALVDIELIKKLEASISDYNNPELATELYSLASEAMKLWGYFKDGLLHRDSMDAWQPLQKQIDNHKTQSSKPATEVLQLGAAMQSVLESRKIEKERTVEVVEQSSKFDDYVATLEGNTDPKTLLIDAPRKLRGYLPNLRGDPDRAEDVKRIQDFRKAAKAFKTARDFRVKLIACDPGHHIHMRVSPEQWRVRETIWVGMSTPVTLSWKLGDVIEIALHKSHTDGIESWGAPYEALKPLDDETSIFDLTKPVVVGGVTLEFSFDKDLKDLLPTF